MLGSYFKLTIKTFKNVSPYAHLDWLAVVPLLKIFKDGVWAKFSNSHSGITTAIHIYMYIGRYLVLYYIVVLFEPTPFAEPRPKFN